MYLTLEIISANGATLGANRRKVMGPEGGLIGRGKDNEWVIEDPHVSRQHASVRCVNGAFFIEGVGKNPLAINDPEQVVANHQPRMLRTGDRIFIDQYEVRASISATTAEASGAARSAALIPDDPFADAVVPPTQPGHGARSSAPSPSERSWEPVTPSDAGHGVLDPLAALGVSPSAPSQPLPPVDWQQASPLSDSYRPPDVPDSPAAPSPPRVAPPSRTSQPAAPAGGSVIPDQWDLSRITQIGKPPPPARPTPGAARVAKPAVPPASPSQRPDAMVKPADAPPEQRASSTSSTPSDVTTELPTGAPASPAASAPASGAIDLGELLRAAGVQSAQISPETARELGEVLKIVIEGVMEVLRARAEIKTQFRMPVTRVQANENNPLKFSPNVEAALHLLLADRNRGYMPAPRAFEDAFADIRSHQLAILEGIRSAFTTMLAGFQPEHLQSDFERHAGGRGGLLNLGGKSRLWDQYVEYYRSLTQDPDDSFRRLFGDEFAAAYEQQLQRLKSAGRT